MAEMALDEFRPPSEIKVGSAKKKNQLGHPNQRSRFGNKRIKRLHEVNARGLPWNEQERTR
jgi:hypothetical protein